MFTKEAGSKKKNPYVLIWEREGPQGNKWNVMETSLLGVIVKVCWASKVAKVRFRISVLSRPLEASLIIFV